MACAEPAAVAQSPCPACEEQGFSLMELKKFVRQVQRLEVHCSMKGRGCDWTGPLEQFHIHLDPEEEDGCLYVDVKCPLMCLQLVPRNTLEAHTSEQCVKRPYICKHCNFKDTYEEVIDDHLPQCKYVPLPCANRCGVTCERQDMEDHMKMCRREEVACHFVGIGCEDRFLRENEEDHMIQKTQNHLSMTSAKLVIVDQKLQQMQEQNPEMLKLEKSQQEKDQRIKDLEELVKEQDARLHQYQDQITNLEKKLKEQSQQLKRDLLALQSELQGKLQALSNQDWRIGLLEQATFKKYSFTMSIMKNRKVNKGLGWTGHTMLTHAGGHAFFIQVFPFGFLMQQKGLVVRVYATPGKNDRNLEWPAKVVLILEVIHRKGGEHNVRIKSEFTWEKPSCTATYVETFRSEVLTEIEYDGFIDDDSLHFNLYVV